MSVATAANPSETPRENAKLSKTASSPCVLPILEGKLAKADEKDLVRREMTAPVAVSGKTPESAFDSRDRTFLTAGNDFIPEDILNSLTQIPVPPPKEQLGPPSKHKKLKPLEVSTVKLRSSLLRSCSNTVCASDTYM